MVPLCPVVDPRVLPLNKGCNVTFATHPEVETCPIIRYPLGLRRSVTIKP